MQLTESSIYIGLKRLRIELYRAQFCMQKADRIIYGTPIMQACGSAIAAFVLAFEVREKRVQYLEEAIGYYAVLRTDLEFCTENNIIHYANSKRITEEGVERERAVSKQKIELFKLVAQIDSDMCKWRASQKGKTAPD